LAETRLAILSTSTNNLQHRTLRFHRVHSWTDNPCGDRHSWTTRHAARSQSGPSHSHVVERRDVSTRWRAVGRPALAASSDVGWRPVVPNPIDSPTPSAVSAERIDAVNWPDESVRSALRECAARSAIAGNGRRRAPVRTFETRVVDL
jgi:hypothetical protein